MAIQQSVAVRNAKGAAYESTIGASPKLQFRTGAPPANCAAARTGTVLAEIDLGADWLTAPSAGTVSKNGTWTTTGLAAAGGGTNAGHYTIMDSAGTVCHEQGTVTVTGGGGDLTVDNISIAQNQTVTVTSFSRTEGNA